MGNAIPQLPQHNKKSPKDMEKLTLDYKPHRKQQEVHISCGPKSDTFWTVVCAGRQGGKSSLSKYQMIYWAYNAANSLCWYVTPSESQSKRVYKSLVEILHPLGLMKRNTQSKGNIMIELINGAVIEFKSTGSGDTLRGADVDYLVLDECAFMPREVMQDAIFPTLTVKGKKALIVSTPKGKNYFYELFKMGEDLVKGYKSFKFTSFDNPAANKDIIEGYRASLPDGIFQQEFLAEWVDSNSVFSNIYELAVLQPINQPIAGDKYYIGVDIALKNDYYVLTVLNQRGEMVYVDREMGFETPELVKRIKAAYDKWKPKKLVIEENSQGLAIIQLLKKDIPILEGFMTTTDSKNEIINQLIAAFSTKDIRILNNEDLKSELNGYIFEYSKTGRLKFRGIGHDDMVMSLAIAWDTYQKNKTNGGYKVFSLESPPKEIKSSTGGIFLERGIGDFGGESFFDDL